MPQTQSVAEFTIRPYRPGDEVAINDRFNEVFGQRRPIEDWHRKFRTFGEEPRIMVAVDRSGAIVSQYAAAIAPFEIERTRIRAAQPVDVFSIRREDVVNAQVFTRTVEAFFQTQCGPDKLQLLYGFPGRRALRLGALKNRYTHYKPVRVWSHAIAAAPPTLARPAIGNEWQQIESFWRRTDYPGRQGLRRDLAWLRNRYSLPGTGPHRFVTHSRGGLLEAWAVFAMRDETGLIADLAWDRNDRHALDAVLACISDEVAARGGTRLEAWAPDASPLGGQLAERGWTVEDHRHGAHILLMAFDPAIDEARLLDRMDYSLGDSDLV